MKSLIFYKFMLAIIICQAGDSWRSSLYPENWSPGFKDKGKRFLHDFSYAGYHNGEKNPQIPQGVKIFNVLESGADKTGKKDSQKAIQQAIAGAEKDKGGVVYIPEGIYRLDEPVYIRNSNVIIKGDGPEKTKLFFMSHKNMTGKSQINFAGRLRYGKEYLLAETGDTLFFSVKLKSIEGLKVGMDAALGCVITDEFRDEHGMIDYWTFAKDKWRVFFRRQIIKIDKEKKQVFFDVPLRYTLKLRDKASLKIITGYLSNCGIEGLSISDAVSWSEAWANNRLHGIGMTGVKDCWIREIDSFPSPLEKAKGYHLQSGGIIIRSSKRVTVSDCKFAKPQNRGGGGNGYLFEISQSSEVLIKDCAGMYGRHNFIQNWDFSTNGCVFLRIKSVGGRSYKVSWDFIGFPAASEFHHALAMANLIDDSEIDDGWYSRNRGAWSSRAGHTSTENVLWNIKGTGLVISSQYKWGYLVGTGKNIRVWSSSYDSAPEDFIEGTGKASSLIPQSLYEDQLKRRLSRE